MAILRPCGKFIRIFTKIPTMCQVKLIEQPILKQKHLGYVYYIHSARYCDYSRKNKLRPVENNNVDKINDKTDIPIQLQIFLEILSAGFKNMIVDYKTLLEALEIYANLSMDTDDSIGIFLLNCCGEFLPNVELKSRKQLAQKVWELLKKKIPQMSLVHYHTYLDICVQNCENIQPEKFINSMVVEPNDETCIYLLKIASKIGDSNSVHFILSKLKELDYSFNSEIFNAMIGVYLSKGDIKAVNYICEMVISSGAELQDDEFYGNLACGYAMQGDIDNVFKLLESHSINNEHLLLIIKTLSLSNRGEDIEKIFKYFSQEQIITEPILYNTIVELVNLQKLDDALLIVNFFRKNYNADVTIRLIKLFLETIVRAKTNDDLTLKIVSNLSETYSPSEVLLVTLKESLSSSFKNLSLQLFEELKNKKIEIRPHYYWPLLVQALKRDEHEVIEIVEHMTKMNVRFDHDTLLHYVLPGVNLYEPRNTLKKLTNYGISPRTTMTSLMCYLLESGQIKKTLSLVKNIQNVKVNSDILLMSIIKAYEITKDVEGCTKILRFTVNDKKYNAQFLLQLIDNKLIKNDTELLKKFVNAYMKYGCKISDQDEDLIIHKLSRIFGDFDRIIETSLLSPIVATNGGDRNFVSISGVPHPRQMNEEQLECHLIELRAKKMNCRGVLRKLFMIHCKNNNLDRVIEIKREFDKNNWPITLGMKSSLIELYARNERVGDLSEILLDIQNTDPNFKIDSSKILCAATALASKNKIEVALEIIRDHGKAKFPVESKCWELLIIIANSEYAELTESTLNLLVENNFCKISTAVLGPLVRQHLLKNHVPAAVEIFKMAGKKYRKTPLRQELISALIELSKNNSSDNNEIKPMLTDVHQLVTEIHGRDCADMELVIGYARSEMLTELRSTLQNLKAFDLLIENSIGAMPGDKKLQVLNTILENSNEMENIQRHKICELILSIYCNAGNCPDAINLWNKMSSEKITPTTVFKNNLSNLLSRHKIQIPSDL